MGIKTLEKGFLEIPLKTESCNRTLPEKEMDHDGGYRNTESTAVSRQRSPHRLQQTVYTKDLQTTPRGQVWPSICLCVCGLSRSVVSNSCYPTAYNLPSSSVHGILQARILEWVSVFVNTVLLEQRLAHSCTYCKWGLSHYNSKVK